MKAMILAIRLKYFYLTYKGTKTEEIRKTAPKNFVGDVYEYVSKTNFEKDLMEIPEEEKEFFKQFKGKVGLKFTLRKVEKLRIEQGIGWATDTIKGTKEIEQVSCVSRYDLYQYCKGRGYAYHIEDLVIFDKPKELCEFMTPSNYEKYQKELEKSYEEDEEINARLYNGDALDDECANCVELTEQTKWTWGLTKAPQSYCFVESEE